MSEITEVRAPNKIIIRCTCGWRFEVSRRMNALARAAKLKAAVRAHWNVCPGDPKKT